MDERRAFQAEFEALGEVEVNDRVERRYYEGGARAYALRWLNDKAMARLTGAAFLAAPVAAELALLARNSRRSARWAMICAAIAGMVTVANFGFAAYAMRSNAAPEQKKAAIASAEQRPLLPSPRVAAPPVSAPRAADAPGVGQQPRR
ncbi:MAG TPA: hypothetical protein VF459_13220 [Caulobacteraceae bacterium]